MIHNAPKSGDPSKWRVAWINDATADRITLRVICLSFSLATSLEEDTQLAPPNDGTTATRLCDDPGQMTGGGFFGLAGSSRVVGNGPFEAGLDTFGWHTSVFNPTNNDTFGVRVVCMAESFPSYMKTRSRQDATFVDVSCNEGHALYSGGYSTVSAGKVTSSAPRPRK